jgi:hypothetical protein
MPRTPEAIPLALELDSREDPSHGHLGMDGMCPSDRARRKR